ncbi:hypothetical protein CSC43_6914 [Pseudomonas aeruginosa]|nr:hypothetical protein CSC43_6914 [Pseudomonas aeruginosa]
MAGQGGVEQAAQAIVQAQRLRLAVRQGVAFGGLETLVGGEEEWLLAAVQRNAVVAQRFEKGQAIGVGRPPSVRAGGRDRRCRQRRSPAPVRRRPSPREGRPGPGHRHGAGG